MPISIGSVEGLLKLRDEFTARLERASRQLDQTADKAERVGRRMTDIGGKLTAGLTLPLVGAAGLVTKLASDFESSFAGIRKTVNATEAEFAGLAAGVRQMAKEIPARINEINRVGELGGQLGIAKTALLDFSRVVIDLAETTNLSAEAGATALARIANITGLAQDKFSNLGSSIVGLGNNFATTEAEIVEFGLRIAGAGDIAGLTEGQILGIGAAMSSVGVEAEAGGTAVQKVLLDMVKAVQQGGDQLKIYAQTIGVTTEEFARRFRDDSGAAFREFVEALGRQGQDAINTLEKLELTDQRLTKAFLSLANAGGLLGKAMERGVADFEANIALTEEAEKRYATFESQVKITVNQLKDVGITLGQALLPVLRDFLGIIKPVIESLESAAHWFGGLPEPVRAVALAVAAVAAAAGPAIYTAGQLIIAWSAMAKSAAGAAAGVGSLSLALTGGLAAAALILIKISNDIKRATDQVQREIDETVRKANELGAARDRLAGRDVFGRPSREGVLEASASLGRARAEVKEYREELGRLRTELKNLGTDERNLASEGTRSRQIQDRIAEVEELIRQNHARIKIDKQVLQSGRALGLQEDDLRAAVEGVNGAMGDTPPLVGEVSDAMKATAADAARWAAGLELIKKGVDAATVRRIIDAAAALDKVSLNDADVRQMAEWVRQIEHAEEQLELVDTNMGNLAKSTAQFANEAERAADAVAKIAGKDLNLVVRSDGSGNVKGSDKTTGLLSPSLAAWDAFVESVAASTAGAAKSSRDNLDDYVRAIEQGMKAGTISVEDGMAAISDAMKRHSRLMVDDWTNVLGVLADRFGGFFDYLHRLAQSIQGGQQFGSSVSGAMSSMGGGWANMASTAGSVATVLYVWYEIYNIAKDWLKTKKAKKFEERSTFGLEGDKPFGNYASDFGDALQDLIKSIEQALRINITDLGELGIKIRNDGKKFRTYFMGVWVGEFNSMQEAMEAALAMALTDSSTIIQGMTDLMQEGLDFWGRANLDGLLEFLGQLREIGDLALTPAAIQAQQAVQKFDELWRALERLQSSTPAVIEGFNNLVAAEARMWQDWLDQIMGREKTPKELLEQRRAELRIFNAELALRKAVIQQRLLEIRATIAAIRAGNLFAGGGGGGGNTEREGGGGGGGGLIGLAKSMIFAGQAAGYGATAFIAAGSAILKTGLTLSEEALAWIAALEAEAVALQNLLDSLPEPGKEEDIKIPKPGRGSRSDDRPAIRREAAGWGLSDIASQLADVDHWLSDFSLRIKEAGLSAAESAKLLAMAAEEAERRRREIGRGIADRFQDFFGGNPFEDIRRTARDLIADIEDSPFGDARKARMLGRVMAEMDRQLQQLANEMTAGLLGSLLQDMERFGATDAQMAAARMHMAVIEHLLKIEHYKRELAILEASGKVGKEVLDTIAEGINFLAGIDPRDWLGGGGGGNDGPRFPDDYATRGPGGRPATEFEDINRLRERAMELLRKYQDMGKDSLTRALEQINREFDEIIKGMGNTAEVISEKNKAIARAVDEFLSGIREMRDGMKFDSTSTLTGAQQFFEAQRLFREQLGAIMGGDLTKVEGFEEFAQRYLEQGRDFTAGEGFRFISKEVQDALDAILRSVPGMVGVAGTPGISAVLPGLGSTATTSMYTQSPALQSAVETGNTLLLSELRTQTTVMKQQDAKLGQMANALDNPLSVLVQNIA